ncbi:MAG: lysoplasmalogenase family protein [Flavobacteriales bacterium]
MKRVLYLIIIIVALTALYMDIVQFEFYKIAVAATTLFILANVLLNGNRLNEKNKNYASYISFGLVCCMAADFIPFLVDDFVWELSFYIVAKFLFAEAFRTQGTLKVNYKLLSLLGIAGMCLFIYLAPFFDEYFVPIALYFGMMIYMSWAGVGLHMSMRSPKSKLVFYAVFVWFICEMISATDRFLGASMITGLAVHVTYWLALVLISVSALKANKADQPDYTSLRPKKEKISYSS